MELNEHDIKILILEKQKRQIDAQYSPLPNSEQREKLWRKSWNLMRQINAMIYDAGGNYREDKRHLLTASGSLNLDLLREAPNA